MPFKKVNVVVEGLQFVEPEDDATPTPPIYLPVDPPDPPLTIWGDILVPEHPIYIPVPPPGIWGGGNEPFPTPPIFLPVPPPPDSGLRPEHPIYWPVHIWGPTDPRPTPPIVLPPWAGGGVDDDAKQKLIDFLFGHLPPAAQPV